MNKKLWCIIIAYGAPLIATASIDSLDALAKKYPKKEVAGIFIAPPGPLEFSFANFNGWVFTNTIFNGSSSGNSDFSNATIRGIDNLSTIFLRELKHSSFQKAKLENVIFDAQLININFKGATLTNVEFRADVSGTFDAATLTNVRFNGQYSGSFVEAIVSGCSDKEGKALIVKNGKLELLTTGSEPAKESPK